MAKKNVFFVGMDKFQRGQLRRLPQAAECSFHAALSKKDIKEVNSYDLPALVERAAANIKKTGVRVDGIASFFDFPGSLLVPLLCERFGVPGPGLESVLKCEHKYWSRLEQQKAAPAATPFFQAFDPHREDVYEELEMIPPFWVKPVKSYRGFLSYAINDVQQFRSVMRLMREKIDFIAGPFIELVRTHAETPAATESLAYTCLAESTTSGAQCTLEGYSYEDEIRVYGIVDSFRRINPSSLSRYEYPTILPERIQVRMVEITQKVIKQIGLRNYPFNIEMFYDQSSDSIKVLEINPRISLGHIDLFEKVHGVSHLSVMVDLALGREPRPLPLWGKHRKAAHFLVRTPEAGMVHRVPSDEEIADVKSRFPGTEVIIEAQAGRHLSQLVDVQDSYSYEIAKIYMGGENQLELLEKFDTVMSSLTFEIEKDKEVLIG